MLMRKITILGETASHAAQLLMQDRSDCPFIIADTVADARYWLDSQVSDILLISRDMVDINEAEILQIFTDNHRTIIWPPDHLIESLIRLLTGSLSEFSEEESIIDTFIQSSEILIKKNQDLTTRITALEGAVRSLLSALSQYDPAAEAYTGDNDAWNLIMQGLPTAGLDSEEYPEGEYDDPEEFEEKNP